MTTNPDDTARDVTAKEARRLALTPPSGANRVDIYANWVVQLREVVHNLAAQVDRLTVEAEAIDGDYNRLEGILDFTTEATRLAQESAAALATERDALRAELDARRAFEEAAASPHEDLEPGYSWAVGELTRRKAWDKSAIAVIIAEQYNAARSDRQYLTGKEATLTAERDALRAEVERIEIARRIEIATVFKRAQEAEAERDALREGLDPDKPENVEKVSDILFLVTASNVLLRASLSVAILRAIGSQAIAHDRQPYPTAEAYEAVCAARTNGKPAVSQPKPSATCCGRFANTPPASGSTKQSPPMKNAN